MHFITFSCYRQTRLLDSTDSRDFFERELERVRRWYGCCITAYVVMPGACAPADQRAPAWETIGCDPDAQTDYLPQTAT
jgi:hypothetical protein